MTHSMPLAEAVSSYAVKELMRTVFRKVKPHQREALERTLRVQVLTAVMTFAAGMPRPIPQPSRN